jgi:hypothetical protein
VDYRQNGAGFPRATNNAPLSGLGDPERWGAHETFTVEVGTPIATYTGKGKQFVRAQAPDLLARGWALVATMRARGLTTVGPDEISFYLDIRAGAGQNTLEATLDIGLLARNGPFLTVLNAAGQIEDGTALLTAPLPASSLAITPRATVSRRMGGVLDHTVTIEISVQIAPWSLA